MAKQTTRPQFDEYKIEEAPKPSSVYLSKIGENTPTSRNVKGVAQ